MIPASRQLGGDTRALAVLSFAVWALCSALQTSQAGDEPLFSQPRPAAGADEIVLINTRAAGTVCDGKVLGSRLQCERYTIGPGGKPQWKSSDWRNIVSDAAAQRRTVVYVHGNRIARGEDRSRGLQVYRSLASQGRPNGAIRFVIWSWPATPIPGPVKDYRVKASRTRPVAWQLAWFLDQLPSHTPVSLLGYSYGARIASGAAHILGGGSLGGLKLNGSVPPQRSPIRIALVAAAFDADWIQPGHFHGRTMAQVQRLVLTTNRLDPVMRFYHLSNGRGRMHALGKEGVPQPQTLGSTNQRRLKPIDFTREVGRSHSLSDYLAVSGKMGLVWHQLLAPDDYHSRK